MRQHQTVWGTSKFLKYTDIHWSGLYILRRAIATLASVLVSQPYSYA
ncbi:MAG: hypothetical protein ACFB14_13440 [Leptolyngbyaceae cyanobacterium]